MEIRVGTRKIDINIAVKMAINIKHNETNTTYELNDHIQLLHDQPFAT